MEDLNLEGYIVYLKKYCPFILQNLEYCFILSKTLKLKFIKNSIVTSSQFKINKKVSFEQSVQYVQNFLKNIDETWVEKFSKMLQHNNCHISFVNENDNQNSSNYVKWDPQNNELEMKFSLYQNYRDGRILIHEFVHFENAFTNLSYSLLSELFSFLVEDKYLQFYKNLDINWFLCEKENRYFDIMVLASICSDIFLLLLSNQKYGDTTYEHCQTIASSLGFLLEKEYFESSKKYIQFCLNNPKHFDEVDVTSQFNYVYSFIVYLLVKQKKEFNLKKLFQVNKIVRDASSIQEKLILLDVDSDINNLDFIKSCFEKEYKMYTKQKSR